MRVRHAASDEANERFAMPAVLRVLSVSAALCIGCLLLATAGCAEPLDRSEQTQPIHRGEAPSEHRLTDAEIEKLVREYLFKKPTADEAGSIQRRIRALNAREARAFHEHAARLNGYTGFQRRMSDAAFEYAQAHGKSFLDLTKEDGVFILAKVTGEPVEVVRARCERSGC
jgi:hypothetical protein